MCVFEMLQWSLLGFTVLASIFIKNGLKAMIDSWNGLEPNNFYLKHKELNKA